MGGGCALAVVGLVEMAAALLVAAATVAYSSRPSYRGGGGDPAGEARRWYLAGYFDCLSELTGEDCSMLPRSARRGGRQARSGLGPGGRPGEGAGGHEAL